MAEDFPSASGGLLGLLDESLSGSGAFAAEEFISLAFELVVIDEKRLQLLYKLPREIFETLHLGIGVVGLGNRNEAVVADGLAAVLLLAFDDADETGAQKAAGKGWLIHENQNVNGVAVTGNRTRQEAEVIGEGHTSGENFL